MDKNNIKLKATIECSSPSSANVVLKITSDIPRQYYSNKELLMKLYKAEVKVLEIQRNEDQIQIKNLEKKFTLNDRTVQCNLFSRELWVKPNSSLQEIFISIRVIHEHLTV